MLNFDLYNPTYFCFGRDTEKETGALVRRFGGTKVLVHYGTGSVIHSGLLKRVLASLDTAGVAHVELGGVVPNPRSDLVYKGIEMVKAQGVDFILGIGGGSAIDSAKAISAGAVYDGDFWDLYLGKVPFTRAMPKGCVITLPATGSEGSNSAVITHLPDLLKRGLRGDDNRMQFAIMNPELTYSLPATQTACGICDIMAHIFERYFSLTTDTDVSDRLCEGVLRTILHAGPIAMANPTDYAARADLCWAGTLAHNGQLGVGRAEDWGSHNISHELSAAYDATHGAALAVVMPQWMRYAMPGREARFAQMAARVFDVAEGDPLAMGKEGISRLAAFWDSLGLPNTLEQLGGKAEDIPQLTDKARCDAKGILGIFLPMTKADIANILTMCLA